MSTPISGRRVPVLRHASGLALFAVLLGCLLALTGMQSASAHAQLLSATPEDGAVLEQAPPEAVLHFSEPMQLLEGSLRLFPGDGDPITLDAQIVDTSVSAPMPDGLADGAYALSYRVVSADGHPISGAVTFTIGDAAVAPVSILAVGAPGDTELAVGLATGLEYLGLLLVAGLILFRRLVLRAREPARGPGRVLLLAAVTAAIIAALLLIPLSALKVLGEPAIAILDPARWSAGVLWPPLVTALLVVVGSLGGVLLSTRFAGRAAARAGSLALMLVALAAPVLVGHTQFTEPSGLMILADFGHLLAGALWIGGVIGLLLFLAEAGPAGGGRHSGTDPLVAVEVVLRFSRLALWSVLVLAVSGVTMGILIVGTFEALFTTGYGVTLLLKLAIVLAVIALAAWNRRYLVPAILVRPTARMRWRTLHRTLAYEGALLVVVLIITGFLTNLSPNHDDHDTGSGDAVVAETASVSGESQQLSLDGEFAPGLSGENRLWFTLEYRGEIVQPESIVVKARLPAHDLGPFEVTPELGSDGGAYVAELDLPVAGEWQFQIIARVSTFVEPIVTIPVTVR